MSRATEREAAQKADAILRRHAGDDASQEGAASEYGMGKLTKAQKKSQEKHIPMKEVKGSKIGRALWG